MLQVSEPVQRVRTDAKRRMEIRRLRNAQFCRVGVSHSRPDCQELKHPAWGDFIFYYCINADTGHALHQTVRVFQVDAYGTVANKNHQMLCFPNL